MAHDARGALYRANQGRHHGLEVQGRGQDRPREHNGTGEAWPTSAREHKVCLSTQGFSINAPSALASKFLAAFSVSLKFLAPPGGESDLARYGPCWHHLAEKDCISFGLIARRFVDTQRMCGICGARQRRIREQFDLHARPPATNTGWAFHSGHYG